jgi:hypothetical protein
MPLQFQVPLFSVEGDDVVFTQPIPSNQGVRFRFHYMPQLVDATIKGAQIESIAVGRASFVYVFNPEIVAPILPTPFDFIRIGGGNQPMGLDTQLLSVNTTTRTITLATGYTVPPGISVGDWAVPPGTTIIPPLPEALMPVLCQRAAYVALRAIGDPKADAALLQCQEMRLAAFMLLQARTTGHTRYLVNRHSPGWW